MEGSGEVSSEEGRGKALAGEGYGGSGNSWLALSSLDLEELFPPPPLPQHIPESLTF